MGRVTDLGDDTTMTPEEAFAVLGDETRIRILHALGDAGEPLSFSELYDRIDYEPSTNFSYHLQKLEGDFVRKTDDGYELGQIGLRVVQAVLTGSMTDAPLLERTRVDYQCEYCGAETEISYTKGFLGVYCTECAGNTSESVPAEYQGYLRGQAFPPTGICDRTPMQIYQAAFIWGNIQRLALASDMCPICSAPLNHTIEICDDHDRDEGRCETCGERRLISVSTECTHCITEGGGPLRTFLLANTEFLTFVTMHGINPFDPSTEPWVALETYDEAVKSKDPLVVKVTFAIENDTIALTVDEELSVVDTTRGLISESDR